MKKSGSASGGVLSLRLYMQKSNISHRELLRTARYILEMHPVFNTQALFSDETENFVSPMEPECGSEVTIRFRTARDNVDDVYLVAGGQSYRMECTETDSLFDYYSVKLQLSKEPVRYYFEVVSGRIRVWYCKTGLTSTLNESHYFRICPGFRTPEWARGAVMYQIFTDRFRNGDPSNDVADGEYSYINSLTSHVADWDRRPENMDVANFYGGDLEGVRQKLDYLKDLGIEVIYFNPLFVSPSNHKYDTQDYDHIDPHFGKIPVDGGDILHDPGQPNRDATRFITRVTREENLTASDELFAQLVREAHERGIRVIIDGVFNHCGSFNKWMDRERIYENAPGYEKGAYVSQESPYRDFFHFRDEHAWPYNATYDGWWNHDTLPKLNYEQSGRLTQYILRIARKWVSAPFNVDGWRLDVAADLGFSEEFNHRFWRKFRDVVKEANPEAVIIAEHYGDCSAWLAGDQWDTVMNYDAFMEPVTWFFTGMEKHSDEYLEGQFGNVDSFYSSMRYHMANFMAPSLLCAMNELSNHDHSRFLTRTSHKVGRSRDFDYDAASDGVNPAVMREAVICQMTWPGAPTVYYGDEAGVCGFTDPDNRRTYPWGHEDQGMIEFHREAIAMHKAHPVLRTGSLKFLSGDYNMLSYARFDKNESIIAAFNNNGCEKTYRISAWQAGVKKDARMERIFYSDWATFSSERETFEVRHGVLELKMPAYSAFVLSCKG